MDGRAVIGLLRSRRSIRKFAAEPPSRPQIESIIEAAGWAPSNHNRQGWKFVVFTDSREIRDLAARSRESVRARLGELPRQAARHSDELLHFAGAFCEAPVVILAMHKRSPAMGRGLLAGAASDLASGEALSTAMAVQNLLLAAHAGGLGACVMTAPLLAGDVWKAVADLPAGFEPTCIIAVGLPAEDPEPPRRKALENIIDYR
jgi:nitroreductase